MDIEIVVESGSVVGTNTIVDDYAKAHPNKIKVVHTAKLGLGNARNTGLGITTGDFIGFVDSDDWMEPGIFKSMYDTAGNEGADLVVCDYRIHDMRDKEDLKNGAILKRAFFRDSRPLLVPQEKVRTRSNGILWRKELGRSGTSCSGVTYSMDVDPTRMWFLRRWVLYFRAW